MPVGQNIGAETRPARRSPAVGDVAPAFAVETLDGRKISLADYRGKAVLLYFWGTWCAPCVAATPHLRNLQAEWSIRYKDFAMISLSMGDIEPRLRDFVKQQKLTRPQVRLGRHSKVAADYGIDDSAPHYFLVGPDGRIASTEMDYNKIKAAVAQLVPDSAAAATAPASHGFVTP